MPKAQLYIVSIHLTSHLVATRVYAFDANEALPGNGGAESTHI